MTGWRLAFRGVELVPRDRANEPFEALLACSRAVRAAAGEPKRPRYKAHPT